MEKSISDKITDLVSQGETGKALNLLRDHVAAIKPRNETLHHSVVMLLGKYNKFEREQRLGLEPEAKDLNRIEYNLLRINEGLRKGKTNVRKSNSGSTRQTSSRPLPQKKTSSSSPIVWVLATLGGLFLLLLIIAVMASDEPETYDIPAVVQHTEEQKPVPQEEIKLNKLAEIPPVTVNPEKQLTDISDQVIKNLLAGSSWLDITNGNGYINFDASGRFATYLGGAGSIQVQNLGEDGLIYALYLHPNGSSAYLAIYPQMEGNNLNVLVQDPATLLFLPVPMIWTRQ